MSRSTLVNPIFFWLLWGVLAVPLDVFGQCSVLDTFETAQPRLEVDFATQNDANTVSGEGILGQERDVLLTRNSAQIPGFSATVEGNSGQPGLGNTLHLSQDALVNASLQITWDGEDGDAEVLAAEGLGGVDLTRAGSVSGVGCNLQGDPAIVTIEVFTDESNASTAELIFVGGDASFVSVPFAAFTPSRGGGADFANAGAVVMQVDGEELDLVFLMNEVIFKSSFE